VLPAPVQRDLGHIFSTRALSATSRKISVITNNGPMAKTHHIVGKRWFDAFMAFKDLKNCSAQPAS
jgi:hypothetical protein